MRLLDPLVAVCQTVIKAPSTVRQGSGVGEKERKMQYPSAALSTLSDALDDAPLMPSSPATAVTLSIGEVSRCQKLANIDFLQCFSTAARSMGEVSVERKTEERMPCSGVPQALGAAVDGRRAAESAG